MTPFECKFAIPNFFDFKYILREKGQLAHVHKRLKKIDTGWGHVEEVSLQIDWRIIHSNFLNHQRN